MAQIATRNHGCWTLITEKQSVFSIGMAPALMEARTQSGVRQNVPKGFTNVHFTHFRPPVCDGFRCSVRFRPSARFRSNFAADRVKQLFENAEG